MDIFNLAYVLYFPERSTYVNGTVHLYSLLHIT